MAMTKKEQAERADERAARPMRVTFTGSRHWRNRAIVRATLARLHAAGCGGVAHGAAPGLDLIVEAEALGLWPRDLVGRYPARWRRGDGTLDRAAGIARNLTMLREEEPHLVVAFPHDDSVGTWHCAVAANCPALVSLLGDGVVKTIQAAQADPWTLESRRDAVLHWVSERVRETIARSRGSLSWPDVTMPDPSKAWALLTPRTSEPEDPRTRAALGALLR